jgi:hypothetical protein
VIITTYRNSSPLVHLTKNYNQMPTALSTERILFDFNHSRAYPAPSRHLDGPERTSLVSLPDRRLLCMFLFLFGQGVIWVGILCLYVSAGYGFQSGTAVYRCL